MPRWFRIPGLVALCLGAIACQSGNSAAPAPEATPAPSDAAWQVTINVQGGFAGMDQRYSAASGANALSFADVVRGTDTAVPLSGAQMQEVAAAVIALSRLEDMDRRSTRCRDCILYDMSLSTGANRKPRRVQLDSTSLDESPEARLIQQLLSLGREGSRKNPP